MPLIASPASELTPTLQGLHLFHFDGAPCAQRVRFALGEKGLGRGREVKFDATDARAVIGEEGRWVSRAVSLRRKQHLSQAYAKIHPDMVVPALVHDGRLYLESMDIITYLDEAFAGPRLVPQGSDAKAEAMALVEEAKVLHVSLRYVTFRWGLGRLARLNVKEQKRLQELAANGDDKENLVSFYQAYSGRSIEQSVFDDHLKKLYTAFAHLESRLGDGRHYLMGDEVSIADAFWAMKVLRLIETGYPIARVHPGVYAWYQRMARRPAFQQEVMGKNRGNYRFFKAKSSIENALGLGLNSAFDRLAIA
ncbi:MAG: glutathione S-transferase family protein [Pseudomonadota bacterium]